MNVPIVQIEVILRYIWTFKLRTAHDWGRKMKEQLVLEIKRVNLCEIMNFEK